MSCSFFYKFKPSNFRIMKKLFLLLAILLASVGCEEGIYTMTWSIDFVVTDHNKREQEIADSIQHRRDSIRLMLMPELEEPLALALLQAYNPSRVISMFNDEGYAECYDKMYKNLYRVEFLLHDTTQLWIHAVQYPYEDWTIDSIVLDAPIPYEFIDSIWYRPMRMCCEDRRDAKIYLNSNYYHENFVDQVFK